MGWGGIAEGAPLFSDRPPRFETAPLARVAPPAEDLDVPPLVTAARPVRHDVVAGQILGAATDGAPGVGSDGLGDKFAPRPPVIGALA
jgi:hypothetical protein